MITINKTSCFILIIFSIVFLFFLSTNIHRTFSNINEIYDCELSRLESDNFFCEINTDWYRRKALFYLQHKRNQFLDTPSMFFQDNYEPTFSCRFEQRIGLNGDGGKWICDFYQIKRSNFCLIYSLGSGGEFSFENETKRYAPHCDIHTFDMRQFNCTNLCTFHNVKIGDGLSGTKSLRMLMEESGHTGRHIDILKIDVEGSEYEFFDNLFNASNHLSANIRQILVELHLSKIVRKVNNITVYDYYKVHRLFQLFHEKHFVIFHKEVNLWSPHSAFEFSFVRLNKNFF